MVSKQFYTIVKLREPGEYMKHEKMLRICLFLGLFFSFAITCRGQAPQTSPERLFSRGNDHYEKAEYGKAIDEYKKILDEGHESGPLYYNMAGAYFKSGDTGKAILNYERAKRFMPRDADLITNYRFARTMMKGKAVPEKGIWARPFLRTYSGNFTVDELTWLSSGAYALIIILLFITVFLPRKNRYVPAMAILFFVFVLFNSVVIWHNVDKMNTTAVTIVPEAGAFFGPFDSATKFFDLREGMDVTVLKAKDDWYKIRRSDGKVGWVKKSDVEKI